MRGSLTRRGAVWRAVAACLLVSGAARASAAAQGSEVRLAVEIVGQEYCAMKPGAASLRMRLRLRYENAGGRRVILYRGHDLFYQAKMRAAAGEGAPPYEVVYLNSQYFDTQPEAVEQPSPGRAFVTLAPGGAYERELTVNVGVVEDEGARGNHSLREGEHALHLVVSTWYKSRPLAQKLRERWARKGFLWFDPLTSAPVRLAVKRPAAMRPCG